MRTAIPLTVLATTLACSLFTAPAQARARVFVASYGNDANPCTFGSPCKTFQQAVNVVDAGGEVTAIDSAGFGPTNITKAVTITSPDGVEAGIVPAAGGDAIDVNAGSSDAIVLRGLTLNGSGVAFNGIVFNSGGSLTVTNCTLQNFVGPNPTGGNGILMQPTSGTIDFTITNTTASNNSTFGIGYRPQAGTHNANGVIDHVVTNANGTGIFIFTGGAGGGTTVVNVSNSIASDNANGTGVFVQNISSTPINASIDNVNVSGNSIGVSVVGTANVVLGRSVITGNTTGVDNSTQMNTFYTYKDNRINLNGTDFDSGGFPLNATFALR